MDIARKKGHCVLLMARKVERSEGKRKGTGEIFFGGLLSGWALVGGEWIKPVFRA